MQPLVKARYTSVLKKSFFLILMCFLFAACSKKESPAPEPPILPPQPGLTDTIFKAANILQSNMVIQRDKPFTLWGSAKAGLNIKVMVSWQSQPFTAVVNANNTWEVVIPASPANNSTQTITIKAEGRPGVVLNNILIGDVWLCSGQSNMVMPLAPDGGSFRGVTDFEQEIAAANYPLIRACTIAPDRPAKPAAFFKTTPEWQVCSPATAGGISAVGYYFARKLHTELSVPVGIIVSAVNNVNCQLWVNNEVFMEDAAIGAVYGGGSASQLYNGMINPLIKLGIKGLLWYQGENNWNDNPTQFTMLNAAMIKGWRKKFNQGQLPFYLVQLTPFAKDHNQEPNGGDPALYDYALFREGQTHIPNLVPGTGIAITNDVGEVLNHHPRNKKPVGERLALFALKNEYGQPVDPLAPTYKSHVQNGKTITINFNNADGLQTIAGQALNQLFFVADASMQFVKAQAAISNNTIVLTLPSGMDKPGLSIRYAFTNAAITNLQNTRGLPVASFRTDK